MEPLAVNTLELVSTGRLGNREIHHRHRCISSRGMTAKRNGSQAGNKTRGDVIANNSKEVNAVKGKKCKFPMPEGFDPFVVFYNEGIPSLRSRLLNMDTENLKGILARFTSISRKFYEGISDQGLLAGIVVREIKGVACRSQAFGDYKL